MKVIEPCIVNRFPGYREHILRKCFQDVAVAELCRDYDALIEALQAEESRQSFANNTSGTRQELLALANALEKELMDRLGPEPGEGFSEANSA
jgi:hypothetical protein